MTFKLLSVTHKIVPSNVQLPNSDSPKLLISICQKIMKGRGNGHVGEPGEAETMKELEFLINFFLRGLAGRHECLIVI